MTRKFQEIPGMSLGLPALARRLAFALKEVRGGERSMLDIAFDYGFSSHEAFTRAFKAAYGVVPSAYRKLLCAGSFARRSTRSTGTF